MKSYLFVLISVAACLGFNGCTKSDQDSQAPSVPTPTANSTADQVKNAQAEAVRRYPDLAVKGSIFNRKFLALYQQIKVNNPSELGDPQWPVYLADQAAQELAAATPPPPTPAAKTPSWFDQEVNEATQVMDVKTQSGHKHH
ncbi:MAG: hypothetical protein QM796_04325 [Chthoniobacteraceae bacterium]